MIKSKVKSQTLKKYLQWKLQAKAHAEKLLEKSQSTMKMNKNTTGVQENFEWSVSTRRYLQPEPQFKIFRLNNQ